MIALLSFIFKELKVVTSAYKTDSTDSKAHETSGKNYVQVQRMGNGW